MRGLRPGRTLKPGRTTPHFLTPWPPSIFLPRSFSRSVPSGSPQTHDRCKPPCVFEIAPYAAAARESRRLLHPSILSECKTAPIAKRTERVNREATRLVPRRSKHFLESFGCLPLLPLERMKLCKDVDLHSAPPRAGSKFYLKLPSSSRSLY